MGLHHRQADHLTPRLADLKIELQCRHHLQVAALIAMQMKRTLPPQSAKMNAPAACAA